MIFPPLFLQHCQNTFNHRLLKEYAKKLGEKSSTLYGIFTINGNYLTIFQKKHDHNPDHASL